MIHQELYFGYEPNLDLQVAFDKRKILLVMSTSEINVAVTEISGKRGFRKVLILNCYWGSEPKTSSMVT